MNRRRFLGSLIAGGVTTLTGCRSALVPESDVPTRKVAFDSPPGGGGGEPTTLVGLYLPAGSGIERLFLPPQPTVRDVLLYAQQTYGLAVELEAVSAIGDFVRRLGAVSVTVRSVPNLFYAVGVAAFTSTDAWEIGVGATQRAVNLQSCPAAGGVIDWRMAIL